MYAPKDFAVTDPQAIRKIMAAHPLASLATNGAEGPDVTLLPLVAVETAGQIWLYGHFARANPHWKALQTPCKATAIFTGVEGYITPSWYKTKLETGKVVPTWNYVCVEARGTAQLAEPGAATRAIIDRLTNVMEGGRSQPWAVADAPERYTEAMLRGIVAFAMQVTDLTGVAKLSQNKSSEDFTGVRAGLLDEGHEALGKAMQAIKDGSRS